MKWVDLREDWSYDMDAFTKAVDAQTQIAYLVNPNNPTGTTLEFDQIEALANALPKTTLLVVDEAYVHFLPEGSRSAMDLVAAGRKNVLVTRTFSKAYGLAGLRIGYGVADAAVVNRISRTMMTGPNFPAYCGALAALDDHDHVSRFVAHARDCRSFYETALREMNIPVVAGHAPLILAELGDGVPEIVKKLEAAGVYVRDGRSWSLPRHIRVSFGTMAQNEAVVSALRDLR